jgi:hypothetical protein
MGDTAVTAPTWAEVVAAVLRREFGVPDAVPWPDALAERLSKMATLSYYRTDAATLVAAARALREPTSYPWVCAHGTEPAGDCAECFPPEPSDEDVARELAKDRWGEEVSRYQLAQAEIDVREMRLAERRARGKSKGHGAKGAGRWVLGLREEP